jgi:hypothetical protein
MLARQDLDLNNGRSMRMRAARPRLMLLYWESTGRTRREGHFRGAAGLDGSLDVIAVQVQRDRSVRAPPQLDDVALPDADESHVGGHLAAR